MAEGKIKYTDLFDADLVAKITALKAEIEAVRQSASQLKAAVPKTGAKAGDTEKLNKAQAERIRLQERLNSLESEEAEANLRLKKQIADKLRQKKEEIKLDGQSESSMQKMSAKLRDLKNQYAKLSAEERKNAQIGGVMLRNIQAQDKEMKRLSATMGDHQLNVGNYSSALSGIKSGFTKLIGVLGIAGGLAGALKLVNSIFNATNSAGDKLAVMFGGLKTGASVFMKALSSGDFSNFLTNMTEAIRVGREYIKVLDDVADSNLSLSINEAESRIEIAAKMKILRDVTVAEKDRIAAADRILEIERINSEKRITNNKRVLDAELDLASTVNNANREQLFDLLKNYDARKNQIQQAEALIEAEDNLNATRREFSDPYADAATVDAAYKAMRNYENVINSADDELKAFTENYRGYLKLTDEERNKIGDAAKKYFESQAAFDEQTSRAATQRSALLALAQKNDLKSVTDYDEIEKERRKAIEQSYIDFIKEAESDLSISIKEINDYADKIDEEFINRKIKRRTEATDKLIKEMRREQKIGDDIADWEDANEQDKLSRIDDQINQSKQMFAENTLAYKVLATAQASMDTYKAANVALAAFPPPYNFVAMGATIAAGLANVLKINEVKFERGEVDIKGRRHSQGGIKAEIEGGESVINRAGTARSKQTLEMINSGLISDKDIIPALALNFNRVPNLNVNNDFSLLAAKQDQTNELLKKFKFMSADGRKVMDINGNLLRYV